MTDAAILHADAIVIDATCPLAVETRYVDWWRDGGATAIAPTIRGLRGDARTALTEVGGWHRYASGRDDTVIVHTAADIERAKRDGKLGLVLHTQGTQLFEDQLDLVDAFHAAGLRMVQLTYNRKNLVGDGAAERTDAGLSHFGIDLIARLNELGMVVDCAHTGNRTSLEAVEASTAPVVISHANAYGLHPNRRNIADDLIKAVAQSGGLVGTVGFPAFLTTTGQPTLDRFIDDIAYKADLVGIDHTGIGIDYYEGQHPVADDDDARRQYDALIQSGLWRAEEYPPPPYKYPAGIETPRTLPALTARLLERGFGEADVRKVLGENWIRIFRQVWGA